MTSDSVPQGAEAPSRPASKRTQVPDPWIHRSTEGEVRLLQLLLKLLCESSSHRSGCSDCQRYIESCWVGGSPNNSLLLLKYDAAIHSRLRAKSRSMSERRKIKKPTSLLSWKLRSLNWPNEQLKIFLNSRVNFDSNICSSAFYSGVRWEDTLMHVCSRPLHFYHTDQINNHHAIWSFRYIFVPGCKQV